jgi:hypothetical protein
VRSPVLQINPDGVRQKALRTIFLVRPIAVIASGHLGRRLAIEWHRVHFNVPLILNVLTTYLKQQICAPDGERRQNDEPAFHFGLWRVSD